MASETQHHSRRKHRRSSSADEMEVEPSKSRKHRHHRHSSRKHEEEIKHERNGARLVEAEDSAALPLVGAISGSKSRPDYEREEGEIVEDDTNVAEEKRIDSDVESGEIQIKAAVVRGDSDMGVLEGQDEVGLNCNLPLEDNLGRRSGRESKSFGEDKSDDELVTTTSLDRRKNLTSGYKIHGEAGLGSNSSYDQLFSGDVLRQSHKEGNKPHLESGSPVEGSCKQKSYYGDESDIKDQRKSLSSESTGAIHKISAHSPSRGGYHEQVHTRNRLRLHDQAWERSRSQSLLQEVSLLKTIHQQDAAYYTDNRKTVRDSDNEETVRGYGNYQHRSTNLSRDKEREHSSSNSRYIGQVYRHHSQEIWDTERIGSRETLERDMEGSRETRDTDKDVDRTREKGRDRERERERERARARERDGDRYRDRDRDRDREGERERTRERNRDEDRERGRERYRERDKESEREKDGRRESGRDRYRYNDRDKEIDRVSRHHKYANVNDGFANRDRFENSRHRRQVETEQRERARKNDPERTCSSRHDHLEGNEDKLKRDKDEQEESQERIALQLVDQEEEDLNRIKEESRRRRQAILEKYKTQQFQQECVPRPEDIDKKLVELPSNPVGAVNVVPEVLDGLGDGADTNFADPSFSVGKTPSQNGVSASEKTSGAGGLGEGTPKSERSNDMFCDDIFGESPAGVRKQGKGDGIAIERSGLHDNWDDAEGYYSYRFGEILDGRYEVIAAHGKGVYSTVVRSKDLKAGAGHPEEVAIKIIRNNETMHKAGLVELVILKKLVGADPENRRHCVRFLSSFKYRNHLCLVFESLQMNLREVLKKFGRNIGLKLTAVRAYAKQLFIALKHLRNCGVLHCDIKPDNMLVNEVKNVLKLCDFGNAMFAGKNEITPYLVSRFYRAPEIILGLTYDHPMDIWSVGCCLFELYTGKVLFPGSTNNDMLRLHMELKGPFPKKMLRKGAFTDHHFDQDLNFLSTEEDPVTKKTMKRLILNIKPKDIGTVVRSSPGEDPKMLANFKDLLEKVFVLDPEKRITVLQALHHPFITGK
ncbi:uncharacterized protein LOC132295237 [Cornus florida]|nr:uncharacterized protein LOC132295237 [Cornus florida]XP_059649398.1 uncharacterized protein LOC132295237 [Cornus florida]XP_059649399.1 uncharacterized protein LOC132295237 [Cornus florida]